MIEYQPELAASLVTGDLLLFSGKGLGSAGIKWASTSRWSHVALVVRLPGDAQPTLWESTTLDDVVDLDTGICRVGVQRVPVAERLASYQGDVATRQLHGVTLGVSELAKLDSLRAQLCGREYEHDRLELLKAAWDGPFGRNREDLSSLFCSELVAEAYQALGLLGASKPSNEYVPADFSAGRRLRLQRGRLGPEILVRCGERRA